MSELSDDLRQAAPAPKTPEGMTPGVTYRGAMPDSIITPPIPELTEEQYGKAAELMGITLPDGYVLMLVEMQWVHDEAAWQRDPEDKGAKDTAYTGAKNLFRYKFKVVRSVLAGGGDLETLFKNAKRIARGTRNYSIKINESSTFVITLGDFQVGKADVRGGIEELLERNEVAKAEVLKQLRKVKPAEIVLIDGGDAMEGFESSPNADRTNDLQYTEQIRVWRRLLWGWIEDLAARTDDLKVVGVPSNHCRVRRGKQEVGSINDDLGLEVIAQVADIAAVNPDRFGHVSFHVPPAHDEHLALTLVGGRVLGAVHGHQKSKPELLVNWCEGQAAGRSPIGHADVVVANHFHNFYVYTWGDDRWLFGTPTMDAGSSWFRNISGRESRPGVLTFVMDENGWRDLYVAWT